MKNSILITVVLFFSYLSAFTQDDWIWARKAGGLYVDYGSDVAVDASGNVYVVGSYIGSSAFECTTVTNAGDEDVFLAKYDEAGNLQWIEKAGGSGADNGISIALDNSGNAVIYGTFASSTITFGAATLINAAAGTMDAFVVKYDPSGTVLWAKRFGGTNHDGRHPGFTAIGGMKTDASNNLFLVGTFLSSTIAFGSTSLTNSGGEDGYLVKLDNDGNVVWAVQQSTSGDEASYSTAVDNSGNVYVTGFYTTPLFGMPPGACYNGFLLKYDSNAVLQWARSQNPGCNLPHSLAIDDNGNPCVAGYFHANPTMVGSFSLNNAGGADVWAAKYDDDGNVLWAESFGGTGYDDIGLKNLVFTSDGILWLGIFSESPAITIGSSTFTNVGRDFYIVQLNSSTGNVVSVNQYGGSGIDGLSSLFIDNSSQLYATGGFSSPDFTLGTHSIATSGTFDMWVGKYGPFIALSCTTEPSGCQNSNINVSYTTSGTYNAGNVFTAQLSNATGSFCSPVNIGSVVATTSGNINGTIPNGTPVGTGYRIRVIASDPSHMGSDNGSNITITSAIAVTYYQDSDNDGFGNLSAPFNACNQPAGYVPNGDDCNDADTMINPIAAEICDGIDNDCDDLTDDADPDIVGQVSWYQDGDGDGFGNPGMVAIACFQPANHTGSGTDCDDTNAGNNPDALEVLDGEDNDCDGLIDEGLSAISADAGDCVVVYNGYAPAECTVLTVNVQGGVLPYTYEWSNGANSASTTVCPEETIIYEVIVTDYNGNSAQDVVTVQVFDISCGNNKVTVCHLPPGNPENVQTICISVNAVATHLAEHGDYLGVCSIQDPCGGTNQSQNMTAIVNSHLEESNDHFDELSYDSISGISMLIEGGSSDLNEIQVYPNPTNGRITVILPGRIKEGTLNVLSLYGQGFFSQQVVRDQRLELDLSAYAAGFYLIDFRSASVQYQKRIVKL